MSDHKHSRAKNASKREETARNRAKDPQGGRGAPKGGSHAGLRVADALAIPTTGEYFSRTDLSPPSEISPPSSVDTPTPADESDPTGMDSPIVDTVELGFGGIVVPSKLRQPSVKNAGRDADGNVVPHKRSEEIAQIVAQLAAVGCPLNTIAVRLNLRPGQIKKYYGNELEHAAEIANANVASAAYRMAMSGENDAMTKFWLKARSKWRDGDSADDRNNSLFNIHIHA